MSILLRRALQNCGDFWIATFQNFRDSVETDNLKKLTVLTNHVSADAYDLFFMKRKPTRLLATTLRIGALAWFVKITGVAPFGSVEVFRFWPCAFLSLHRWSSGFFRELLSLRW